MSGIVGRDTNNLDIEEISRATIETVAENTVDGILSPLFFAFIGGAPLAMAFKAASTLDSMVGYKNERYMHLGWFSAKMDDVLNYIPARIGFLVMLISAAFYDWNIVRGARTFPRCKNIAAQILGFRSIDRRCIRDKAWRIKLLFRDT